MLRAIIIELAAIPINKPRRKGIFFRMDFCPFLLVLKKYSLTFRLKTILINKTIIKDRMRYDNI
jgi:hypothetical protein